MAGNCRSRILAQNRTLKFLRYYRISLKFMLFFSAFIFIGSVMAASPPAQLSSSAMAAEIRSAGAQAVLCKYYDTPGWSKSVLPGIRSAAHSWLEVGVQLRAASDSGASEDLDLAIYTALAVAPMRVLPLLLTARGGTVEQLCNIPFETEIPKQGVAAYIEAIRAKLGDARTEDQRAMAAACSRGLDLSLAAARDQGLIK
jgi:hypothetical protein